MIPIIESLALKSKGRIAIGVAADERIQQRTISGAIHALKRGFAQPVLIGTNIPNISDVEVINTENPENTLFDLLMTKKVSGVVRGSFRAGPTLKALKAKLKGENSSPGHIRIALVQNPSSEMAMCISPVGIDEGTNLSNKNLIISKGIELLQLLGVTPHINVLAAGLDPDDIGRNAHADETIKTATELIKNYKDNKGLSIKTSGILVEEAIEEGANIILAPDGISGNLLFRTLVHVADWKSFGAVLSLENAKLSDYIYIDTSRIGTAHEYLLSLTLASALAILR